MHPTTDDMEVDDPPIAQQPTATDSAERIEAFKAIFGQHMRANHKDTLSIAEVEDVVNIGADVLYSRAEIMSILEKLQDDNICWRNCAYGSLRCKRRLRFTKLSRYGAAFESCNAIAVVAL